MCKCKYCGKKVKQTPGKKEREYCNASCRQKHWQQKKREGKGIVKITQEEYDSLKAKIAKDFTDTKNAFKDINKQRLGESPYNPMDNPLFKSKNKIK